MNRPHLVWIAGIKGPCPQKWINLDFGLNNWKRKDAIHYIPITEVEFNELSLSELEKKYPLEKQG